MFVKIKIDDKEQWISKEDFFELLMAEKPNNNQFEEWLKLYDKKRGKIETLKYWDKNIKLCDIGEIMEHTKKYVINTDKNFRKDPVRYLRHKCWKDEVIIKVQTKDDYEQEKVDIEDKRAKQEAKRTEDRYRNDNYASAEEVSDILKNWRLNK